MRVGPRNERLTSEPAWPRASHPSRWCLPAQDLDGARAFYRDKPGLGPAEERPGGLRYVLGETEFALFASGSGECAAWLRDSEGNLIAIGQLLGRAQDTVPSLSGWDAALASPA